MVKMQRKFYNKIDYTINGSDGTENANRVFVHLQNTTKKPKKITGTTFAAILGKNKYINEFEVFCKIFRIDMPILDYKYINAGIAIEPILRNHIMKKSDLQIEHFDAKKYNYDYFKNESTILGGLPDGFIKDINMLIEFKTTNWKMEKHWVKNGVPENYIKQVELYAYLKKATSYSVITLFVKDEDYANPQNIPINNRKILIWTFETNKEKILKDIKIAASERDKWIKSLKSPKFDVVQNKDLLSYLKCENKEQWEQLQKHWILIGKLKV